MALLDRLHIRGIRSFSPNTEETVKFSTPVTLFLGQNGCGKTTIIECLKYALTSELPMGADSGRGFVSDPKLCDKSSTKGSIKVRFLGPSGDYFTVSKTVEVSIQAGGKIRFKSMIPAIRRDDGKGNISDVTGRCVDIDIFCSQTLNVSKSIINDVIFCHQENSSWPLGEGKKLKEKFDEFFGSNGYNKCVDRLRKLIRDKKADIKVLKEQHNKCQFAVRITDKLKNSLNEKEVRHDSICEEIQAKEQELAVVEEELKKINDMVDSLNVLIQKLTGIQTTLKGVQVQEEELKKHLKVEFKGSDEELENEIKNFSSFQNRAQQQISQNENKLGEIDLQIEKSAHAIQKKQILFGQLKQEEAQNLNRVTELNELIAKNKDTFNILVENDESNNEIITTFKRRFDNIETTYNELQEQAEVSERALQDSIDQIRVKLAAAEESHSSKNSLIEEYHTKYSEAKSNLKRLEILAEQKVGIERKIEDLQEACDRKNEVFNEDNQNFELEQIDYQIIKKDQIQSKLEREHRILQQNYFTDQKIEEEKKNIVRKEAEIYDLKQKHQQNFQTLFGQDIPENKFETTIVTIQKREEEKLKMITNNITNCERNISSLEATAKHTKEKLQTYINELKLNKSKVESACKGKPISEMINESYAKKDKLQKDKGCYRSAKILYEQYINKFQQDPPCCAICQSDFSNRRNEIPKIIKALSNNIESVPKMLSKIEVELQKEEDFYNKLQQLQPISKSIQELEEIKIPILEEELHNCNTKLTETLLQLDTLKSDLASPQSLVEVCRNVSSDATLLDRLLGEVEETQSLIKTLAGDVVKVGSNRTLVETETELSLLKADLANLRKQYRTKRDLYDEFKDSIQTLNGLIQLETHKKLEIQRSFQDKPMVERQIHDCRKMSNQLKQEVKQLETTITTLKIELKNAESNRNEEVQNNKKKLDQERNILDSFKRVINDMEKLNVKIHSYTEGGNNTNLESVLNEIEDLKNIITKHEETKKDLINNIVKIKEELASQESKLRALKDNKDLRLYRKKIKNLETEIQELKKQIGPYNSNSICEQRRKIIDKIDSKRNMINKKIGEKDTLAELIETDKAELNKKEHKEVYLNYKKKFYELKVVEMATADLEIYTEALEKSILKFHEERMVQINMTIRELWRNIYKGNDIDYIQIKTIVDTATTGASKKRVYDYKVVQVKKGTELEMRGRCSAGQKVLACLVIRMALAETFSANCGILALDEPTTNLDRDNIVSLSDALSKIISTKEKQKNFQLLIITHDQDFLETLRRDQSVSTYYKVQRRIDGFSEIKRETL